MQPGGRRSVLRSRRGEARSACLPLAHECGLALHQPAQAQHPYPAIKDSSSSQHASYCRIFPPLSPRRRSDKSLQEMFLNSEPGNGRHSPIHGINVSHQGSSLPRGASPFQPCPCHSVFSLHFLYDSDLSAWRTSLYFVGCELPFGSGQLYGVCCSLALFSLVVSQHLPEGWSSPYASSAPEHQHRPGVLPESWGCRAKAAISL